MKQFTIAVQPDDYGKYGSSSSLWTDLLHKRGHTVRLVDVRRADILEQLKGCDGFMWRWGHFSDMRQIAKRLLPVVEHYMKIAVYPDQQTCWHYDDKIAQAYLFEALNIPTPRTWIWYDREMALEWAKSVDYPLVVKLWGGASSYNVRMARSYDEIRRYVDILFGHGTEGFTLDERVVRNTTGLFHRMQCAFEILVKGSERREPPLPAPCWWDRHKNYLYVQEFLPGNEHDTRITIVGKCAFGFRRFNRENDFRASGGANLDLSPAGVDERFVRLAFSVARKLKMQNCAMDGLWKNGEAVAGEISYTSPSGTLHRCAGHWELTGDPASGSINWVEGAMWPEEAQIDDYLKRLAASPEEPPSRQAMEF